MKAIFIYLNAGGEVLGQEYATLKDEEQVGDDEFVDIAIHLINSSRPRWHQDIARIQAYRMVDEAEIEFGIAQRKDKS